MADRSRGGVVARTQRKASSAKTAAKVSGRLGRRAAAAPRGRQSVIMQARIDGEFARTLVERDARVLGLSGPSDLVREGLRLVHRQAQEKEMAEGYDRFYGGQPAPLPAGVVPSDHT